MHGSGSLFSLIDCDGVCNFRHDFCPNILLIRPDSFFNRGSSPFSVVLKDWFLVFYGNKGRAISIAFHQ